MTPTILVGYVDDHKAHIKEMEDILSSSCGTFKLGASSFVHDRTKNNGTVSDDNQVDAVVKALEDIAGKKVQIILVDLLLRHNEEKPYISYDQLVSVRAIKRIEKNGGIGVPIVLTSLLRLGSARGNPYVEEASSLGSNLYLDRPGWDWEFAIFNGCPFIGSNADLSQAPCIMPDDSDGNCNKGKCFLLRLEKIACKLMANIH